MERGQHLLVEDNAGSTWKEKSCDACVVILELPKSTISLLSVPWTSQFLYFK